MANCVHTSINQEETRCDKNACAQDSYPVYTIQHLVVKRLYNRFDNRLYRVNKHPTGCQTGCQSGLTTGLTTVLNEQPLFVQPVDNGVVQPVDNRVVQPVDNRVVQPV